MFLSDRDIEAGVTDGSIVIKPFSKKHLQMASYDVTLGNEFQVTDRHSTGVIDPYRKVYPVTRTINVKDGEAFILHPGESVLGKQKEFIGVDHNHLILLSGKSSLARAGLVVHNTAMLFNPGHHFYPTFELVNTNNVPIILRPGMEVAQLLLRSSQVPLLKDMRELDASIRKTQIISLTESPRRQQRKQGRLKITTTPMPQHPELQYLDLLRETLEHGEEQVDSGTGVKTYSVFGRQIRFDLSQGFPLLTTKKTYWNGILQELYWFMSGQSNIKYLVDNNVHIWDDYPYKIYVEKCEKASETPLSKEEFIEKIGADEAFAAENGELPHIYGEQWRRWEATDGRTVDQLGWAVDELRKDPDAHNTLVTSWNPEYMYAMARPGEGARFPICHNMYQLNIKNGKVSLQLYQRSADVFLGVPFNIGSYALLTIIIAKILGREPGEFVHTFGDLHIYENHKEQALEQLTRTPNPFPRIEFTQEFDSLDSFRPDFVNLVGYEPHPPIKAELTVSGGYNKKLHG